MEYIIEEVQPLEDDSRDTDQSSQSNEEIDSISNLPENSSSQLDEDDLYESPQSADEIDSIAVSPEDSNPQSTDEIDLISISPEDSNQESVDEIDSISIYPEDSNLQSVEENDSILISPEERNPQPAEETGSVSIMPEASDLPSFDGMVSTLVMQGPVGELNSKKIALILSGGGARGAFQVGAEKYARDVKGYHWDIIAGVSVGALNGAMLAMHRYPRLMEIWNTISNEQVYTGGFNLLSLVRLLFGAKSFYGNAPLQKLMQREFEAGRVIDDLHVGAVSLISGEYVQFTKESLELAKAILASASIPVVWPPVDVAPDRTAMVDGGVRNITPVGDVLALEPDEIVIINCSPEQPPVMPQAPVNVLSIGIRALDIMQNEIFINDMKEFLRINALVQEAEKQGCLLHNPKTGKLLKYYPCQVIEPNGELGGVLDFSKTSIQAALKAGVRRAREVLGRP